MISGSPPFCSVCRRSISVTNAGLVRVHGPIRARCLGSSLPPVSAGALSLPPQPSQPEQPAPPTSSNSGLCFPSRTKVIKRIPKSSRLQAAKKLAGILKDVVTSNDVPSWLRLFHFSPRCFHAPRRGGRRWSLVSAISSQLSAESDPPSSLPQSSKNSRPGNHHSSPSDADDSLAMKVSSKLEEGDFNGAVRLACSDDKFAPFDSTTLSALQSRHPPAPADSSIPPVDTSSPSAPEVLESDVLSALSSFPCDSAAGPDCLRPQHLKDMCDPSVVGCREVILPTLVSFVRLVLDGKTPAAVRPFFFGANLVALQKNDGGVRPIAVGNSLRRLVAKVASARVVSEMSDLLAPRQLGFGVQGGAEAAVHAARLYLANLNPGAALLKLDFKNAFNSIRRDKMLLAVLDLCPSLFRFVHSAYASTSSLFWGTELIHSAEGVQQGDPLGPLLFCLSIHSLISGLQSELCFFYLDDGTLGGGVELLQSDVVHIQTHGPQLGLYLNSSKTEIISLDGFSTSTLLSSLPGAKSVEISDAFLLGSPIGDLSSVTDAVVKKTALLSRLGDRLNLLNCHDALVLLRYSLAIPKFLYSLRSAPCFAVPALFEYDNVLCSILSRVSNCDLSAHDSAWLQASLPVKLGGLGIRSAVQLAPSAFLASSAASVSLVQSIVPLRLRQLPPLFRDEALSLWSSTHNSPPPSALSLCSQKSWDLIRSQAVFDSLLESAPDPLSHVRLLACSARESGVWLDVFPSSSLGLRMDDNTIRTAIGLRLGLPLCSPHICRSCGDDVGANGLHGLSCRFSAGRHFRHSAINDIIHRALTSAKIPSRLEPTHLSFNGSRPDGVTMVPWTRGKCLAWDATCVDTFAPSYLPSAATDVGLVADRAEEKKIKKYANLQRELCFSPIAFDTMGVVGSKSMLFLRDLGRRIRATSNDPKSFIYLLRRLAVTVQRGNAISILGTIA